MRLTVTSGAALARCRAISVPTSRENAPVWRSPDIPGYLFLGPGPVSLEGAQQFGPLIVDRAGRPVWFRPLAPGLTPRAVLDKLAAVQMLDVQFPTTDGRTLILSRYTELNADQKLLVKQLNLGLPPQPPPRITAPRQLARAATHPISPVPAAYRREPPRSRWEQRSWR